MAVTDIAVPGLGIGIRRHNLTGRGMVILQPRASQVFQPGSAITHRNGVQLAEVPSARTDLVTLGYYDGDTTFTASSTADSNGGAVDANGNPQSVAIMPISGEGTGWFATGTGSNKITSANVDADCYWFDDDTLYLTDLSGTLSWAGKVASVDSTTSRVALKSDVLMRTLNELFSSGQLFGGGSAPNKARAMVTSLAAYAGSLTGQLTASATGAFGTQDGVSTFAVGDVVFIPPVISNLTDIGDSGPWEITVLGGTGIKWVLTRPAWFTHGAAFGLARTIEIGPEGTGQYAGLSWRAFCAPGTTVDTAGATTDPTWFPREYAFSQTIGGGGSSTTDSAAYIRDVRRLSAFNATTAHAFFASTLTAQSSSGGTITQGTLGFTGTASDVIKGIAINF